MPRAGRSGSHVHRLPESAARENPLRSVITVLFPRSHIANIMPDLLNSKEIKAAIKELPEWDLEGKTIERTFEFDDFSQAIDFVNGIAELADEVDHHPDMDIRYSKVRVILSTHSKGGLTEMDFDLAEKIGTLVDA